MSDTCSVQKEIAALKEDLPKLEHILALVQQHATKAKTVVSAQKYLTTWADSALGKTASPAMLQKARMGLQELEQAKQEEGALFKALLLEITPISPT